MKRKTRNNHEAVGLLMIEQVCVFPVITNETSWSRQCSSGIYVLTTHSCLFDKFITKFTFRSYEDVKIVSL